MNGIPYKNPDGSVHWRLNGKLHREDGPAVERGDGHKEWWLNGKPHREDGPAREWADGYKEWWLNGQHVFDNMLIFSLKGNYVVLERDIPTDKTFDKLKLTHAKLLTATGTIFVYDNLPGSEF